MSVTARRRIRKVRMALMDEEKGQVAQQEQEIVIDAQESEARDLTQELARRFIDQIDFILEAYHEDKDGKWTPKRAGLFASEHWGITDVEKLKNSPPDKVRWADLTALANSNMRGALELWASIKAVARDHVESGAHVAEIVCPNAPPLERARMFALREQLVEGWQPQNGIEHALMDVLALSYSLYLYWTAVAHERVMRTAQDYKETKKGSPIWTEGKWNLPTIYESQAVDQANRLADGYHRQFMRTLRQLRDLRRYMPEIPSVVVQNNGGQVNVAGQQVQVTRAE